MLLSLRIPGFQGNPMSLLAVGNPYMLLWALKPHEDGVEHGIIARLRNLSETAAESELSFTPGLSAAYQTTHIETDFGAIPTSATGLVPMTHGRQELQTVRPVPKTRQP